MISAPVRQLGSYSYSRCPGDSAEQSLSGMWFRSQDVQTTWSRIGQNAQRLGYELCLRSRLGLSIKGFVHIPGSHAI